MSKSFLEFTPYQIEKKKTINVEFRNTSGENLGEIQWDCGWRRYVFVTSYTGLKFDSGCLKEIADYCDKLMQERAVEATQSAPGGKGK